ncbi:MAG: NAD-dependent epimerase/dehydratase family protein [Candidatus Binatia bacterium]
MKVIITGAAGGIGTQIVDELSAAHELYLIDRVKVPGRKTLVHDLSQARAWGSRLEWRWFNTSEFMRAFSGADVILHLAAESLPEAPWKRILRDNIQATQYVLETAAKHRVKRVVFASSNWAVKALERELAPACYLPGGPKLASDVSTRPLTDYGVSKALGEITGRMYVDQKRLESFVAVRIGHFSPKPLTGGPSRDLWIGAGDLRSLLCRCVEAAFKGFHVVYGVSAQPTAPYDLSHTRALLQWEPHETFESYGRRQSAIVHHVG